MVSIIKYNDANYLVDSFGNVFSKQTKQYLKHSIDRKGYAIVTFCKEGKHKKFKVHRLVALKYIPNILNKPEMNHKDGNKLNNSILNLEWVTAAENQQHAWDTGLQKLNSSHFNCRDTFLKVSPKLAKEIQSKKPHTSMRKLAKEYGLSVGTISRVINEPEKYYE